MENYEVLVNEIREVKTDMKSVESKAAQNAENIAKLTAFCETIKKTAEVIPLLVKWVIFPLVAIISGGFSAEQIISKLSMGV